jgi:hypothetical protein
MLVHGREIEVIPTLGEFAIFYPGHAQAGELYRFLFASVDCRQNRRYFAGSNVQIIDGDGMLHVDVDFGEGGT